MQVSSFLPSDGINKRRPLKIFFLVSDTGLDIEAAARVGDVGTGEIRYDGWVRNMLAPKSRVISPLETAAAAASKIDEYNDDEDNSKVNELILPLWSKEHIEASAMYIKQTLY
jgi:hypothetical protein